LLDVLHYSHVLEIQHVLILQLMLRVRLNRRGGLLMRDQLPDSTQDPAAGLAEEGPVTMPELPHYLSITTLEQLKALGDPVREKILRIIQNEPATAKQIADRLSATPGAIGHHLQVLEAAGLARVAERRLVRGIVAKYYTRTARIFNFDKAYSIPGSTPHEVDFLGLARDEVAESHQAYDLQASLCCGLPHARLSLERAAYFKQRVNDLADEFIAEPQDPNGKVYGLSQALFMAPPYMQRDVADKKPLPAAKANTVPAESEKS
jgi:DNA-binding transcriptional ArsR family regulator